MALPRMQTSLLLLCAIAACFGFATVSAMADAKPTPTGKKTGLIPREILFGNPDKAGARLSPDGKRLSFLAPSKGVMNVWVGPANNPAAAKPVTNDKKRGIRSYFWGYTSNHVLYTQDKGGDENFRVYCVDLSTGETRNLTPEKNKKNPKFKVRANIQDVSREFPQEILVGLNDRDARFHDIYKINIETGEKTLVQKNDGYAGFVTDDEYKVRFGSKFAKDGGNVFYKPTAKGEWEKFLHVPQADSLTTDIVGFSKDGKSVYMIDSRGRDTAALVTVNLATGKKQIIAQNKLADVGTAMLHPKTKAVQAVSFNYTRRQWKIFDKNVQRDFAALRKVANGDITITSRTKDDKTWVVAFLLDNGPVKYYVYNRTTGKARYLFSNRADLEGVSLAKMHPVVIPSRDKLNLVSYLTLPTGTDKNGDGRPEQALPTVLMVHGGPWARDNWGYNPYHQFLANRGYAVLSVNYRGSTGFGKNFINAGNKEWAGKMHNDLIDAVDWAINEKIAIPNKVAIMGGSYGGYATLVGLTFTPEKFACGVDIVGPSNILTLLKTIPPYWAPAIQLFKDRVGDFTTKEGRKFLEERSPLTHVAKIKRPLLIGQGANDPRVKQSESDQIVKAMQKRKIPVTYVLFPDEGHGFARPNNRLAFMATTEVFLAQHLGGRYQAYGDAFEGSSIRVPTGADGVPGLSANLPKVKK